MNPEFPPNPAMKLQLPEVESPDSPEARRFVAERQPFLCRIKDWTALEWSIPYLQAKVGHVPRDLIRTATQERFTMSTSEFLEMIEHDPGWKATCVPAEGGGPPLNLRRSEYASLLADLRLPSYVTSAREYSAMIMMRNSRDTGTGEFYDTPAHYELNVTPSIYLQVRGKKHLWLFGPGEAPLLGVESCMTEPPYLSNGAEACVHPERYPQLKDATCYEVVLGPGDLVYWPEFWVHWFVHHHDFQLNLRIDWRQDRFELNPMSGSWAYCNALAESLGGFANFQQAFRALPPETQELLVRIEQTLLNQPRVLAPGTMTIARNQAGLPIDTTKYVAPKPTTKGGSTETT